MLGALPALDPLTCARIAIAATRCEQLAGIAPGTSGGAGSSWVEAFVSHMQGKLGAAPPAALALTLQVLVAHGRKPSPAWAAAYLSAATPFLEAPLPLTQAQAAGAAAAAAAVAAGRTAAAARPAAKRPATPAATAPQPEPPAATAAAAASFSPSQLAQLLDGLAALRLHEQVTPAWLALAVRQVEGRSVHFSHRDLADALYGIVRLGGAVREAPCNQLLIVSQSKLVGAPPALLARTLAVVAASEGSKVSGKWWEDAQRALLLQLPAASATAAPAAPQASEAGATASQSWKAADVALAVASLLALRRGKAGVEVGEPLARLVAALVAPPGGTTAADGVAEALPREAAVQYVEACAQVPYFGAPPPYLLDQYLSYSRGLLGGLGGDGACTVAAAASDVSVGGSTKAFGMAAERRARTRAAKHRAASGNGGGSGGGGASVIKAGGGAVSVSAAVLEHLPSAIAVGRLLVRLRPEERPASADAWMLSLAAAGAAAAPAPGGKALGGEAALVNTVWALARLGYRPGDRLLRELSAALPRRLEAMRPGEAVLVLRQAAIAGVGDVPHAAATSALSAELGRLMDPEGGAWWPALQEGELVSLLESATALQLQLPATVTAASAERLAEAADAGRLRGDDLVSAVASLSELYGASAPAATAAPPPVPLTEAQLEAFAAAVIGGALDGSLGGLQQIAATAAALYDLGARPSRDWLDSLSEAIVAELNGEEAPGGVRRQPLSARGLVVALHHLASRFDGMMPLALVACQGVMEDLQGQLGLADSEGEATAVRDGERADEAEAEAEAQAEAELAAAYPELFTPLELQDVLLAELLSEGSQLGYVPSPEFLEELEQYLVRRMAVQGPTLLSFFGSCSVEAQRPPGLEFMRGLLRRLQEVLPQVDTTMALALLHYLTFVRTSTPLAMFSGKDLGVMRMIQSLLDRTLGEDLMQLSVTHRQDATLRAVLLISICNTVGLAAPHGRNPERRLAWGIALQALTVDVLGKELSWGHAGSLLRICSDAAVPVQPDWLAAYYSGLESVIASLPAPQLADAAWGIAVSGFQPALAPALPARVAMVLEDRMAELAGGYPRTIVRLLAALNEMGHTVRTEVLQAAGAALALPLSRSPEVLRECLAELVEAAQEGDEEALEKLQQGPLPSTMEAAAELLSDAFLMEATMAFSANAFRPQPKLVDAIMGAAAALSSATGPDVDNESYPLPRWRRLENFSNVMQSLAIWGASPDAEWLEGAAHALTTLACFPDWDLVASNPNLDLQVLLMGVVTLLRWEASFTEEQLHALSQSVEARVKCLNANNLAYDERIAGVLLDLLAAARSGDWRNSAAGAQLQPVMARAAPAAPTHRDETPDGAVAASGGPSVRAGSSSGAPPVAEAEFWDLGAETAVEAEVVTEPGLAAAGEQRSRRDGAAGGSGGGMSAQEALAAILEAAQGLDFGPAAGAAAEEREAATTAQAAAAAEAHAVSTAAASEPRNESSPSLPNGGTGRMAAAVTEEAAEAESAAAVPAVDVASTRGASRRRRGPAGATTSFSDAAASLNKDPARRAAAVEQLLQMLGPQSRPPPPKAGGQQAGPDGEGAAGADWDVADDEGEEWAPSASAPAATAEAAAAGRGRARGGAGRVAAAGSRGFAQPAASAYAAVVEPSGVPRAEGRPALDPEDPSTWNLLDRSLADIAPRGPGPAPRAGAGGGGQSSVEVVEPEVLEP
ncbi:hypothetical protein GPECTOR_1g882 [Gonium pectorale]|uniref:Uncharacterized protein n=1 Tax=Gonium pectorale TaxID=33097 RepID=A0A150H4B9_GONPE|nr:hypothetical protein GPECTOR_1g882 [Gonium pectorale]|eukprot:KXZ56977.1 hypothetical protein GPECTOR_1g882 [Gonium pectorale]